MTQLMTARKLTKSEMQAIQGGGETAPPTTTTPPPTTPSKPAPCDNKAGRGYTYDKEGDVVKCPTAKCFPDQETLGI
jgi:hypothetical protein